MSAIARAAGVSRQTLYKEFGSRDEFGQAFVIDEGERFLDDVEAAVREHLDDPRAAVGAALKTFLVTAGEDPLVRILLSDDGTGGMLPFVTTQGMPVVQWATARLTVTIQEGWPQAPADKVSAPRRVPGPPRDQLHHRPQRLPGDHRQSKPASCSARSSTRRWAASPPAPLFRASDFPLPSLLSATRAADSARLGSLQRKDWDDRITGRRYRCPHARVRPDDPLRQR